MRVWIVGWATYDGASIEKIFLTEEQATAYVTAREYVLKPPYEGFAHWVIECNGNWVTTAKTEACAQEKAERHRTAHGTGDNMYDYYVESYEVEP